jgi:uncharacterized protein (DUF1697 family)
LKCVALLRGINVGGKNIIKMSELKSSFIHMGFRDASTFIQSGNVIFSCENNNLNKLTAKIEEELSKTFNYHSSVLLYSQEQLREAVSNAPDGFGKDSSKYRYDVIFLKEPLSAEEAMKSVAVKEGVDMVFSGRGVLYFSRLISKASQSRLPRLISKPVYKSMSVRNWQTTTKLLSLMDQL